MVMTYVYKHVITVLINPLNDSVYPFPLSCREEGKSSIAEKKYNERCKGLNIAADRSI